MVNHTVAGTFCFLFEDEVKNSYVSVAVGYQLGFLTAGSYKMLAYTIVLSTVVLHLTS